MTETLIALPVLLVFSLCLVQFGLIYRAKITLEYAAHEAARAGALNNGMPVPYSPRYLGWWGKTGAIRAGLSTVEEGLTRGSVWQGLVKGMMPLAVKRNDLGGLVAGWADTNLEMIEGACIEYLNPTQNAFLDWGFIENAGPDRYVLRLPNDTMRYRKPLAYDYQVKRLVDPAPGGVTGRAPPPAELRGAASNRTLGGANVLHLRVHYGYKLNIPVANRIIIGAVKGYQAVVDVWHRVLSTEQDLAPDASTTLTRLDAYHLKNGRLPLVAEGVVGMETPLYWHPFYSFGPSTPSNYGGLASWDAAWSVNGTNVLEPMGDSANQIMQYVRNAPFALAGLGVKDGVEAVGTVLSDLNHFCPAIWASGSLSPLQSLPNPFAGASDSQAAP